MKDVFHPFEVTTSSALKILPPPPRAFGLTGCQIGLPSESVWVPVVALLPIPASYQHYPLGAMMIAPVAGVLPAMWETHVEVEALGFRLTQFPL